MLRKILNFLLDKKPEIFNLEGKVEHQLPKKIWDEWHNHYKINPQYNWKNHKGFSGK